MTSKLLTLNKWLFGILLTSGMLGAFCLVYDPEVATSIINSKYFIMFISIYLGLIYTTSALYAIFAKSMTLYAILMLMPITIIASLVNWEYREFIENKILEPLFGTTSVIGAIFMQFMTLQEEAKKREDELLKREEQARVEARKEAKKREDELLKREEQARIEARKEAKKREDELLKREEQARIEAKERLIYEERLKKEEILEYEIQRSLQRREMDFKLTIEFRNKIIQKVMDFIIPIPSGKAPDTQAYTREIVKVRRIIYDVYMYFNSITLVKKVINSIKVKLKGDSISDEMALDLIRAFRQRLDFDHDDLEIKRIARNIYSSNKDDLSWSIKDSGLLQTTTDNARYIENSIYLFLLANPIPGFKDLNDTIKLTLESELESKLDDYSKELKKFMEEAHVNGFNEDAIKDILIEYKITIPSKSLSKDEKLLPVDQVINNGLRDLIKYELGIEKVTRFRFLRLIRKNNNNFHFVNWLKARYLRDLKDLKKIDPFIVEGHLEFADSTSQSEGDSDEIVFCWSRNNKKIGSTLLGVFIVDQYGNVKRRLTMRALMGPNSLLLADSGISSQLLKQLGVEKIEENEGIKIKNIGDIKEILDVLPKVFDALNQDDIPNVKGDDVIVRVDVTDPEKPTLIVPFSEVAGGILSYALKVHESQDGGVLCSYKDDVYRLSFISLKDLDRHDQARTNPQNELYEIELKELHEDCHSAVANLDVCLGLHWSKEDDPNQEQDHPLIRDKTYYLSYNQRNAPTLFTLNDTPQHVTTATRDLG